MADDLSKKIDDFQGLLQKKRSGGGLKEQALESAQEPANAAKEYLFNMSGEVMFACMVCGALGFAYLKYGHRQRRAIPFCCGLALVVFPYLVKDLTLILSIGLGIAFLPLLLKLIIR